MEQTIPHLPEVTRDILSDVTESVNGYGNATRRADVKDLTFPEILQEIMNRVLAAERQSQAELVEARTRAEVEQIESESRAEVTRRDGQTEAESQGTSQDDGEPPGTAATCRTRIAA
ncbi:hypothetical protein FF011L_42900 [Roseimaritima multifibrata]|uniref:Band 7 domain-containing protein n=1 Tax=Roseimaritima multifibrata TaxID=1930274 RepID=A0A517MKT7_9BACT|nr:SPFH domain-containing protein [Roseimaritima multifibrata]QDS95493.1 hypothetical protein FF011L_42900 [Roseimaritima multifibrata]